MFHKAINLRFCHGTVLELTFDTGEIKKYDVAVLFEKYPQLEALKNRELFTSGRLMGSYGIIWNDEFDIEAETVYEDGMTVKTTSAVKNSDVGEAVMSARANAGLSHAELSLETGISQADISRIERGTANPSVSTLKIIASALGKNLEITIR